MPAERRSLNAARPVKTERTHEENQERAYIAASRRSDRSLEARIESARRASEIHKKRTGRALRVTEQDVMNEEMYEEEDDDLPAQYQRLNAHLHTSSVMFNKKLQDYIATQHGVRNMFMSQYQSHPYQPYGAQYSPSSATFPQGNIWLNSTMLSPQQFSPTTTQAFSPSQSFSPTAGPSQGFRQAPYRIPQRSNAHQRALSIQLPQSTSFFDPSAQPMSATVAPVTTPQPGLNRRLSLPPRTFEQSPSANSGVQRRPFSRSPPVSSPLNPNSPASAHLPGTPQLHSDAGTPTSYPFNTSAASQTNPLTFSLPPESQQFIGSALDPNDPQTSMLMAGSDNLPQPFAFNPSYSKSAMINAGDGPQALSSGLNLKIEPGTEQLDFFAQPSNSDEFLKQESFLTPGVSEYSAFFDYPSNDNGSSAQDAFANDQGDGSNFVNWE